MVEIISKDEFIHMVVKYHYSKVLPKLNKLFLGEHDSGHVNFMAIRKGVPKRCECGHWFKAVDADPESV